jgi:hypothetical protein
MAKGFIHTVHRDGRRNRKTEHVIHNQDGTISEPNSCGNDPANRPG